MPRIFISYSRNDREFAQQLARALNDVGINVWIDVSDVRAGKVWWDEIQRGLDDCDTMILIISPDSMASRNVSDEWGYYLDEGKQIIPIRWLPAKVQFRLRGIQYVEFYEQAFEVAFARLCTELNHEITERNSQGQTYEIGADRLEIEQEPLPPPPDLSAILPPPFGWCSISAGEVILEDASSRSGTKGGVFAVSSFYLAKYPVTNAQYEKFVEAGYSDTRWWEYSAEAKAWHAKNAQPSISAFADADDHPRVNVTWYDAVAFCNWLNSCLETSLPDSFRISLPAEQEWQRAANGDTRWVYPWGNDFDSSNCNSGESGIGRTTPVTQYPQGASPYGVIDMSGNAWEWCSTLWETPGNDLTVRGVRCLRGGSWRGLKSYARVGYRGWRNPDDGDLYSGFRIALCSADG